MKNAFDSVPLEGLELALRRVKLSEHTIKYVLNLFYKRQLKIITVYSLTEEIIAGNGIDQESYCQIAVAYANDTTWIANSKKQLIEIISIAKEFF
ncbi:45365_t:CDS:2 [Gigaspora margarita]|uniref:45365_t:CDS:1 n=1 Tax=Gigaspora margarita TaxID=4874 RepID=A0ABN7UJM4_GIGMA|nr:45365_t:CDS:2 [Gigaspora margarita]